MYDVRDENIQLKDHDCMQTKRVDEKKYIASRRYACYIHALAAAPAALASSAAATAGFTFLPSFQRTRGGGARLRRPSRERTRTTEGVDLVSLQE